MAILIKRYANRKLYNTETSRYITLKGIAELLEANQEVRVIDNETGEDITSVALSQILVDSERTNSTVPGGLLSQILGRGGDALYGVLRRRMDDASEGFEEIHQRVRRAVGTNGELEDDAHEPGSRGLGNWIAYGSPDFERIVQGAVERVFGILDLPRRKDVEALSQNLERVAEAVEKLERLWQAREDERVDEEDEQVDAREERPDPPS